MGELVFLCTCSNNVWRQPKASEKEVYATCGGDPFQNDASDCRKKRRSQKRQHGVQVEPPTLPNYWKNQPA